MKGEVRARICGACNATGLINPNESTGFAPYIYNRKVKCPECRGTIWIIEKAKDTTNKGLTKGKEM